MLPPPTAISGIEQFTIDYDFHAPLFHNHTPAQLASAALHILNARHLPTFTAATFFILDVSRGLIPANLLSPEAAAAFQQELHAAGLDPILRSALLSPNLFIRLAVIDLIGRTCHPRGVQLLEEPFPHFLLHDPLTLDHLFFEHRWLRGNTVPLLTQAVHHSHFAIRWSALAHVVPPVRDSSDHRQSRSVLLDRLAQDPHPWVRAEACFLQDRHQAAQLPPEPRRTRHRELRQRKKSLLTWDGFQVRFLNVLGNQRPDYTLTDLDSFAASHQFSV